MHRPTSDPRTLPPKHGDVGGFPVALRPPDALQNYWIGVPNTLLVGDGLKVQYPLSR